MLFEERVLFSPTVPEAVNQLLQEAVAASHANQARAEKLFIEANALDSRCLQTYFALYKFYFHVKRLADAEAVVLQALAEAASQGGFVNNPKQLTEHYPAQGFYLNECALFYLYSLKALAFIKLRQDQTRYAHELLAFIKQLDPEDRSGASVIMDLAQGVTY